MKKLSLIAAALAMANGQAPDLGSKPIQRPKGMSQRHLNNGAVKKPYSPVKNPKIAQHINMMHSMWLRAKLKRESQASLAEAYRHAE